jgi:ADP-ribose pyrophosphatase YjhB (NUDIX family)
MMVRKLKEELDDQQEVEQSAPIIRLLLQELEEANSVQRGRILILGSRKGQICRGLAERMGDKAIIVGMEVDALFSRQAQHITNLNERLARLILHVRIPRRKDNFISLEPRDFIQGHLYDAVVIDERRLPSRYLQLQDVLIKLTPCIKPGGLILCTSTASNNNNSTNLEPFHPLVTAESNNLPGLVDFQLEQTVISPTIYRCRVCIGPKERDESRRLINNYNNSNSMSNNNDGIRTRVGCVVVDDDDRILWISRRSHPDSYVLPAGRLEPGETKAQGAVREALEEAGVVRGEYVYEIGDVHLPNHSITTFFLLVKPILVDVFSESSWRRRRWLTIDDAQKLGCISESTLDIAEKGIKLKHKKKMLLEEQ